MKRNEDDLPKYLKGLKFNGIVEFHTTIQPYEWIIRLTHNVAQGLEPLIYFSVSGPIRFFKTFRGFRVSAVVNFHTMQ